MNDLQNFIEKATRYLQQQREMFGDFAVDIKLHVPEELSEPATETPAEISNLKEEVINTKKIQPDIQEQIDSCNSLEELRILCESAEELKTDLENTKMIFGDGNPNADLMIIGEAPGAKEDELGVPFVGRAGKLLNDILKAINFSRDDVFVANILKHRPPENRNPLAEERNRSLPYLMRQIELIDPKLILCVGKIPGITLLGRDEALKNLRQKFHSFHGRELMVTYHPAALLRNPNWKRPTWEDVQLLRKRYDELGCKP